MKPVLMIHEVHEWMLDLPLEDYVLTFDDGLYTQYKYIEQLNQFDTQKIFFISSNILCKGKQSTNIIACDTAHQHFFDTGDTSPYMTVEQIKELATYDNVYIGGHSHHHYDYSMMGLLEKTNSLKSDTEAMLEWFDFNFTHRPTKFCYPYNKDYDGLYKALLKRYGFKEFYGAERTPIESLSLVH